MTIEEKESFLREEMFTYLQDLSDHSNASWGKMNAQQMLEHLNDFFNVSIEKIIFPLATPEEHLFKYKQFLYSEKLFKENTKAPAAVLGEEPLPVKTASLQEAKNQLKETVEAFFNYFNINPAKQTMHPAFGMLNFEEWIMLHYKHAIHHLKQFNLNT
jgi:oxepin-CoA hydrolase/3-oxo-5,6-dehydrosuberyl-CoA semialdehyde dehydrogenase